MSNHRDTMTLQRHGHTTPDDSDTDLDHHGRRFPVTVVRLALIRMPTIGPVQRRRRARATAFAEAMAEAACEARPYHNTGYNYSVAEFLRACAARGWSDLGVPAIPEQACALLTNLTPGALAACRTEVGRVTAALLHGSCWSLVLRPRATPPRLWIYLDRYDGRLGYGFQGAELEATWGAMTAVLAATAQITPTAGRPASHMPRARTAAARSAA